MKTTHASITALLMLYMVFFASCKTSETLIDVMRAAEINIPQEIKTLAVINRSLPAKEEEVTNVVEGIITGELILNDRFGSEQCITGLANAMSNSPRFSKVVIPDVKLKGTGTTKFPPLLDWANVGEICSSSGTDALIALETFDSNVEGRLVALLVKQQNPNLRIKVETGWRVYDPSGQRLIDENVFVDYMDWNRPITDAPARQRVVEEAGYFAGTRYAGRISPLWIPVKRMYFKKGNNDFKIAHRLVQQGLFNEAGDIWSKYIETADKKIAGYACYNMGLVYEVNGNLEEALNWVKKSLITYGNRKAGNYIGVLNYRISERERLNEQLKE